MLGLMLRIRLLAAATLLMLAAGCAPSLGPPAPGRISPVADGAFSAADFAWSQAPGRNTITGRLAYHQGPMRFTCAGASVILTPETPWSRRRMAILYGSADRAAQPTDAVRARTPQAPPGDSSAFIKRTTCDPADRFSFSGLPNGAWFVITIARPADGGKAASVALMRRVVTRGGRATTLEL